MHGLAITRVEVRQHLYQPAGSNISAHLKLCQPRQPQPGQRQVTHAVTVAGQQVAAGLRGIRRLPEKWPVRLDAPVAEAQAVVFVQLTRMLWRTVPSQVLGCGDNLVPGLPQ